MTKPPKGSHSDHDYQQGYEQGAWDTENRLGDDIAAATGDTFALESIAAQIVTYFGDLATTLRELPDLRPREVDVLKRVTRDHSPQVVGLGETNPILKRGTREV